jgi:hypothetical protein
LDHEITLKNLLLQNIKIWFIYLVVYIIHNFLLATNINYQKLLKDNFHYVTWNDNVLIWIFISFLMNYIIAVTNLFKKREKLFFLYFIISSFLSILWFLLAIIPGLIVYFLSGGIMS